ncbi:hypothetical protein DM860_014977 [Cuscuta australis]|uniref:GRF-type domain-containing protein n=1 Tax=Cuscuta australis TaxID=267555 RepID=A0A328E3N3_9ASTE|nr:hypothetical protein DM860_014977 [Cuscuta australis]
MDQKSHSFNSSRRTCEYDEWLEVPTCRCGKDMSILISWTDKNPGRRMWKCDGNVDVEQGTRKCRYWEWLDPPICDRAKKIIPGLLKKSSVKHEEIKLLN